MPYESGSNTPDPGDTPIPSSVIDEANSRYQLSQLQLPRLPPNLLAHTLSPDFFDHSPFMFEPDSSPPPRGQKRARTESPDSSRTLKREAEPGHELGTEETCKAMRELAPKLNRLKGRVCKLSKKVEADQGAQRRHAVSLCEDLRDDMNEWLEMMTNRLATVEKDHARLGGGRMIRARLEDVEKGLEELKGSLTELQTEEDEQESQSEEDEHEIFIAYEYKPEIQRIDSAISDVQQEVETHWGRFDEVRAEMAEIEGDLLGTIESKTERLESEITRLKSTNTGLEFELAELRSGYQDLKANMEDLKATLGIWAGQSQGQMNEKAS